MRQKFLKGNYRLPKGKGKVTITKPKKNLTDRMEESALAKLGGSLCFVTKKGAFIWSEQRTDEQPGQAAH